MTTTAQKENLANWYYSDFCCTWRRHIALTFKGQYGFPNGSKWRPNQGKSPPTNTGNNTSDTLLPTTSGWWGRGYPPLGRNFKPTLNTWTKIRSFQIKDVIARHAAAGTLGVAGESKYFQQPAIKTESKSDRDRAP